MFDINLLTKPGLQADVAVAGLDQAAAHEEALLDRLQARAISEVPPAALPDKRAKSRLWVWQVIIFVILAAAAYWWYQGWSWKQLREIFPSLETSPAVTVPQTTALPSGSNVTVLAQFLGDLSPQIAVDYLDAGAGVLVYRVRGGALGQSLLRLNNSVVGRRYSDLITPLDITTPGCWLGTVIFASRDQLGALRPIKTEYERFFRRLRDKVSSSGGVIVETVPGTMTAGEYVLRGSLDEIKAHITSAAGDSSNVHYHRMSLLKSDEFAAGSYLLRVIFNLIEERSLSPRLLSPGGTGA